MLPHYLMRITCLLLIIIWVNPAISAETVVANKKNELQIAVAPFLPAHLIVRNYQPMREYLEQQLNQPVTFITAPDYATFYERTRQHDYTVIITVAHAAYLAYAEDGYIPMLRPINLTQPVLVTRADSQIKRPVDLKGKVVAMPDALAMIAMQGIEMLHEAGLDTDKDITVMYLPNHSAAVNYVVAGEVAGAIVSDRALLQMPAATKKKIQAIEYRSKGAAPGIFYLANANLPAERIALLSQKIQQFVTETPQGKEFINKLGYGGLVPATRDDLLPLANYGAMFKTVLYQHKD